MIGFMMHLLRLTVLGDKQQREMARLLLEGVDGVEPQDRLECLLKAFEAN